MLTRLALFGLRSAMLLFSSGVLNAQEPLDLFNQFCSICHGSQGQGTLQGPAINDRVSDYTPENLQLFLTAGSPERGMPPAPLQQEQIKTLTQWLQTELTAGKKAKSMTITYREVKDWSTVSTQTLLSPPTHDWLWFSRTANAHRHSPLTQINKDNVSKLAHAWKLPLGEGMSYTIPLVHDGLMFLVTPQAGLLALEADTGEKVWEYQRLYGNERQGRFGRAKSLAIFDDMIYYTAPDSYLVAVDARTGELRWETQVSNRGDGGGVIVVDQRVISGGTCGNRGRVNCVITAHDAYDGELLWQFYTTQSKPLNPAEDTWYGLEEEKREASPWGLPGSWDSEKNLLYWGIANPMPNTRRDRHPGRFNDLPLSSPVDLYSNSTVALDPVNGELQWYYQHLPGDDWDLDMNEERMLIDLELRPDLSHVKWINPKITPGELREVVVNVGEGGGLWVLDRETGEFLWATQFPGPSDNFFLEDINVETGATRINSALFVDPPGTQKTICYFNTRSFWPSSYDANTNSLYVPYIRNCLKMTSRDESQGIREERIGSPQDGYGMEEVNGLAKINLVTGEIHHWAYGKIPTNSAMLSTSGGLIFWGDIWGNYEARESESGEVLWHEQLEGPVTMSNITYSVNGRQYVAIISGATLSQNSLTRQRMGPFDLELNGDNSEAILQVFSLPN
jgi:alcohol dehydrogenase (cytochrome c)